MIFCLPSMIDFPKPCAWILCQYQLNYPIILHHISIRILFVNKIDAHGLFPFQFADFLKFPLDIFFSKRFSNAENKPNREMWKFFVNFYLCFIKSFCKIFFRQPLHQVSFFIISEKLAQNCSKLYPLVSIQCELSQDMFHIGLEDMFSV